MNNPTAPVPGQNVFAQQTGGVSQGSNRINSTAQIIGSPENRASGLFTQVLPAGGSMPINIPGSTFYVTYCSSPLSVRPYPGGAFDTYPQGTGRRFEVGFTRLDLLNPSANPCLFQIWVGFDEYIDKRLILSTTSYPIVAYPTYPTANAATSLAINDLSGTKFTDINGNKWWAISREGIYVFNIDTGVTALIQKAGAITSSGPAVGAVYPQTSLRLPYQGNYSVQVGGGNINLIVSEGYYALPAT